VPLLLEQQRWLYPMLLFMQACYETVSEYVLERVESQYTLLELHGRHSIELIYHLYTLH
jgi:hypothetical protein